MKGKKQGKKKRSATERDVQIIVPRKSVEVAALVQNIAGPLCQAEGMELVHVEYQGEPGGLILRIYIDKSGGVTLEDCVLISRQLNDLLDIHLEGGYAYNLEVSSPGRERPLSRLEDYERYKGELARIKTIEPFDGIKNFKGLLMGTSDDNINIMVENRVFTIPHKGIWRARLVDYNGDKQC